MKISALYSNQLSGREKLDCEFWCCILTCGQQGSSLQVNAWRCPAGGFLSAGLQYIHDIQLSLRWVGNGCRMPWPTHLQMCTHVLCTCCPSVQRSVFNQPRLAFVSWGVEFFISYEGWMWETVRELLHTFQKVKVSESLLKTWNYIWAYSPIDFIPNCWNRGWWLPARVQGEAVSHPA